MRKRTLTLTNLYYISFVIVTITFVFGESILISNIVTNTIINFIRYLGCLIMLAKMLLSINSYSKVTVKSLFWILSIVVICVIIFFVRGVSNDFLILLMFMIMSYDTEQDRILSVYAKTVFVCLTVIIALAMLGLIENDRIVSVDKQRFALGFVYVSFASNFFFHAVVSYVSFKRERLSYFSILAIFSANLFLYVQTRTRAVFILIMVLMIVILFMKVRRIRRTPSNRIMRFILIYSMPLCVIFSFSLQYIYNMNSMSHFMRIINGLVSNRLHLAKSAIETYGYTIFGQNVTWYTFTTGNMKSISDYFYVDSSYIQIAIVYGFAILLAVCAGFVLLQRFNANNQNIWLLMSLLIFSIHCIMDPQLLSIKYDPFLLTILPAIRHLRKNRYSQIRESGYRVLGKTRFIEKMN